jgi:hypothetical protein
MKNVCEIYIYIYTHTYIYHKKGHLERVLLFPQEMPKIRLVLAINLSLFWNKYINLWHCCLAAKKHYLIHWCWILRLWKCECLIVSNASKCTKWIITTTVSEYTACRWVPKDDTLLPSLTIPMWWLHSRSKVMQWGLHSFITHQQHATLTFEYLPWC